MDIKLTDAIAIYSLISNFNRAGKLQVFKMVKFMFMGSPVSFVGHPDLNKTMKYKQSQDE